MPTKEEIAYIAGLFDGEGSINISKMSGKRWNKRTDYRMMIRIANTNKKLLDYVKDVLGFGGVYVSSKSRSNICYSWTTHAKQAEKFLKMVFPYLIDKKLRAEAALEFRTTKDNGHNRFYKVPILVSAQREEIYQCMKLLNSREPELQFLKGVN